MKLGRFAILMIGIMIFIASTTWGYFYCYMPNMKEVGLLNENKALNDAEAAKMPKAKARFETAKKMIDVKAKDWMSIVETRTPPMDLAHGGIDLSVNPWQLAVDTPKYRDSIQRAVNTQLKKGGVKVISAPLVTPTDANAPVNQILSTFFNYPALKFPVVIFDFGTITVQGTYKQILDNVRAYKNMPNYLAVADGLRLDGTSPNLTGTYNLTIVGFMRTKSLAPDVPEGAAVASTGMQGMGGTGMSGIPPSGMPAGIGTRGGPGGRPMGAMPGAAPGAGGAGAGRG
jgi:hypothetical protein